MTTQTVGHTPGPWRVERGTRIEFGPILAGDGWAVAKILRDIPEWQWKANACLIAAAPDLLAACKGLAAKLERSGEAWMSDPDWLAASAAIAKAEA